MKKLAIISTHPIQYNSPLFKELANRNNVIVKVFYTWGIDAIGEKYDRDFGRKVKWDIPLLNGYEYQFVNNISFNKGTHSFLGIIDTDLESSIKDFEPDSVLIYGWSFLSHLLAIKRLYGQYKIIFRGDSNLLDEQSSSKIKIWLRRKLLTWIYKSVNIALFVGEANKLYFMKYNINEHNLIYAPHAIDNDRFSGVGTDYDIRAQKWREELGIANDDVVFMFAGKLESKKNPIGLLSTFMEIDDPKAKLIIVGTGVLEKTLKLLSIDDDRVVFLGFQNQSDMPIVYKLCDVFVLPSIGPGETWGLCINEAMASNRSCIISNKCGCAIDLGRFGNRVFEPTDMIDLKKNMMMYLNDKGMAIKSGKYNGEVINAWSIDKVASVIESIV